MRGRGARDGARSSRRVYVTVGLGCRATRGRTRGVACARQGGRGSESKALWLKLLEGRRRSKVEGFVSACRAGLERSFGVRGKGT